MKSNLMKSNPMKSRLTHPRAVVAALGGGVVFALLPVNGLAELTGNLALTSDYVWRGSSQTREDPAVQAGVKYAHDTGLYASLWGSNVKFVPDAGTDAEMDLALGWSGALAAGWALDVYWLRYQYPSADIDTDWNEVNASIIWRDHHWIAIGHSTHALASAFAGTYAQLGMRHLFNDQWRAEAAFARYFLDPDHADSYNHGSLGVVWIFHAPLEARLTWHDTDSAAEKLFPDMAGSRAEFALQASF